MSAFFIERAFLPSGWATRVRISVNNGLITAVTPNAQPAEGDERLEIGLPGMPNLHSHAFQRGMAGLAEVRSPAADSFWTWRNAMYRLVGQLSPDDIMVIAMQAYVEMLEAGFTRVGEFHYLHHDIDGRPYADPGEVAYRIVAAAAHTGIQLTLLPVFYAHSGFDGAPLQVGQIRFSNDIEHFANLLAASGKAVTGLPGGVLGVAPHSLRAVTPDELVAVVELAGEGPIHIHVAEQINEVEDCLVRYRQRPVEWLLAHQSVSTRWCLIHATHMTDSETVALARSGAVVGLCPITEANLGDGVFNLPVYLDEGGRYGVGTDSNVLIGLADELRMLEYSQRLALQVRNVSARQGGMSTGRALIDGALAGGNQSLGVAVAGLAVGASADIISLAAEHTAFASRSGDAIFDGLIFTTRADAIDGVWTRGLKVVSDGRHHAREEVARKFRQVMKRLLHG